MLSFIRGIFASCSIASGNLQKEKISPSLRFMIAEAAAAPMLENFPLLKKDNVVASFLLSGLHLVDTKIFLPFITSILPSRKIGVPASMSGAIPLHNTVLY